MTKNRTLRWMSATLLAIAAVIAVPASADFVINDDLIVDGSACIGFDCVNGESFGFDTLRLKENNLRIKFDDTSVAASYPRNDWQITANDSANGGQSKFSIDDISGNRTPFTIEANARSHSLYVDDGGRIGSRTSTPAVEIHTVDGDTPTLRLQQDGSSGFAQQTWDLAGNETNFFVRDVTNGSQLPFRIRPDAPTSSIFVDVDGDVGMGTSSPDSTLNIARTTTDNVGVRVENATAAWDARTNAGGDYQITLDGSGGAELLIRNTAAGDTEKYIFAQGTTQLMEIEADGDVNSLTGVFGTISDRNVKTDINPVDPRLVLAKVADLPISTWRFRANSDELHMGPMAQDFWAAFQLHEGEESIALNDLSGVALAAIKGLNSEVEELNRALETKDALIQELLARVVALESQR